ncbi:hypothetical protein LTS18_014615, partial [Coniosporium uncinatum]
MGVDTRPLLPAPTEPSVISSVDNGSLVADDLATDLSRRTDQTSYSIPEDGSPVTITTKKTRNGKDAPAGPHQSETSLLIEYFEARKGDKVHSRPSVRVRVTPSSQRKGKSTHDHIQITESTKNRKPSYTRRISLGSPTHREEAPPVPTEVSYSSESNLSGHLPVEVEVLQNHSDISKSGVSEEPYVAASDVSSMPPDSMLEGDIKILSPRKQRSEASEEKIIPTEAVIADTLKAPEFRDRNLSRERITQKVMEKLAGQPEGYSSGGKHRHASSRDRSASKEDLVEGVKSPSKRRSSKSHRDEDSLHGADSSLNPSDLSRRSDDKYSIRSGT